MREDHDHEHEHHHDEEIPEDEKEITAMLVRFKNQVMGLTVVANTINRSESKLTAAQPSIEVNSLLDIIGVGIGTLETIAYIIVLVSLISVFVSLYNALKERRYEMALMRVMGASRFRLFSMVLIEGLLLAIGGYVLGIALSRLSLSIMAAYIEDTYQYSLALSLLNEELYLLVLTVAVGLVAALIPALQAFKMNISKTLADA